MSAPPPLPPQLLSSNDNGGVDPERWVVLGGAGFIGGAICERLHEAGADVLSVDVIAGPAPWRTAQADVLVDSVTLPPGRIVLGLGRSTPRPLRPWTLVLDNALATARVASHLREKRVTLLSSIEVYGPAPAPLTEDSDLRLPVDLPRMEEWVDRALVLAASPCPPDRGFELSRELVELDPSGRWIYAMSKLTQELIVRRVVPSDSLTVLRLANVIGRGQFRVVSRFVEAMLEDRPCVVTDSMRSFVSVDEVARVVQAVTVGGTFNVSSGALELRELAELVGEELGRDPEIVVVPAPAIDSCGVVDASRLGAVTGGLEDVWVGLRDSIRSFAADPGPMFRPPLPVVLPPRPEHPHVVSNRIASTLWSGQVRDGRWSAALQEALAEHLRLGDDRSIVLTNSGTNALRLAIVAAAGSPGPRDVAVCPAFTFHATAEVLRQLGWSIRFADVDPDSWTLAPESLAEALDDPAVRVVVTVDALGNPCDYESLVALCKRAGVPLVADSAAALGSLYAGVPVGAQADAHAFSMSFAKVVSGGGSGGALVVPNGAVLSTAQNWPRSAPMTEMSAIVALDGLDALEELAARRGLVAATYEEMLSKVPDFLFQHVRPADRHAWVHWVMRVGPTVGRDRLALALSGEGVQTKPYYEPLAGVPDRSAVPVTQSLHEEALALPMSSELTRDDAERVALATIRALRRLRDSDLEPTTAQRAQETAPLAP